MGLIEREGLLEGGAYLRRGGGLNRGFTVIQCR